MKYDKYGVVGIIFQIRILFILLTSVFLTNTYGQTSEFVFTQYTVEDGLPSNECHDVFQDSEGYIWIATDNGIAKYDGYEFKTYGHGEGLEDLVIFKIYEAPDGKIWVGGLEGKLYVYDRKVDKFTPYKFNKIILQNLKNIHGYLKYFIIDDRGILTVNVGDSRILQIDKNGNLLNILESSTTSFTLEVTNGFPFLINKFYAFIKNIKPDLRINDESNGIYCLEVQLNTQGSRSIRGSLIKLINNQMYFTFWDRFLIIENGEVIEERIDPGIIAIQSNNKDQVVLLYENGLGCRIFTDALKEEYIQLFTDVSCTDFLEDKSGGYWLTTIDKGLLYIKNSNIKFVNAELKDGYYNHICLDSIGNIYVSEFKGKITKTKIKNKTSEEIFDGKGFDFRMLEYDSFRNNLWISTSKDVLIKNNTRIYSFKKENISFFSLDVSFSKEKCFFLFRTTGFGVFDYESLKIDTLLAPDNFFNITKNRINDLLHVENDSFLIGHSNGVGYVNSDLKYQELEIHELLNVRIEKMLLSDEKIYFATKGNGLVIQDQFGEIHQISETDGLLSNQIESIVLGEDNAIWISTLKGINKLSFIENDNYQIKAYTTKNGLSSNSIYEIVTYEKNVYAATHKGVIEITESDEAAGLFEPIIKTVKINGVKNEGFDFLDLPYDNNNIQVDFRSLDFQQEGDITYRIKVNEEAWKITKNNSIHFPDLSPNSYLVEIQAQNIDGIWSDSSVCRFKISKPWWNTYLFYSLMIIFIVVSLSNLFLQREKRMLAKNKLNQEINTLEKSALQAQMNPHFIFNCLNSIQSFISQNDKIQAMEYLGKFAKLIRLYLKASVSSNILLEDEMTMLNTYCELESLRFNDRFVYEISHESTMDTLNVKIPSMLIQPFVENAIVHGMKSNKNGKISVFFSIKNDILHVQIEDNGKGFDQQKVDHKKSLGMSITQKRLNHIMSKSGKDYDFEIDSNNQGTTIILNIPFK